jgi:outer membrane lipoprotein SlyB
MPQRIFAILLVGLVSMLGCRTGQVQSDDAGQLDQIEPSELPNADAIPPGTELRVELNQKLSTEDTQEGDSFSAKLIEPLVTVDGETVVPAGAMVRGEVTGVASSNRPDEQAAIRLQVQEISFGDQSYEMPARIVQTEVETDRDKSDIAAGAAVGGVAGAALGAIIGQDAKGALIGGALGAGTGTIISLGYGTTDAELPAGSEMTLRTTRTVELE